jgi:hypothetical protein
MDTLNQLKLNHRYLIEFPNSDEKRNISDYTLTEIFNKNYFKFENQWDIWKHIDDIMFNPNEELTKGKIKILGDLGKK